MTSVRLTHDVSEVDGQSKHCVQYPCYEKEIPLLLEAHEGFNKAGSVLTYQSPLVDPQIRRIETTASKYRGVEQK